MSAVVRKVAGTVVERPLLAKHEQFAQRVATGSSYAGAYREVYGQAASHWVDAKASALAKRPDVAARIRELSRVAAEAASVSVVERMQWLDLVANTDASEVTRTHLRPCDACWSDAHVAAAWDRDGTPPDTTRPRIGCNAAVHVFQEIIPTHELSAAGRAIFRGVKVDRDGNVQPILEDRMAAADLLNRMQSVYVDRSVQIRANVNVPNLTNMSNDDVLDFLDSIKPAAS